MKRDADLGWELIGHDPVLRLELNCIEQLTPEDEMVNSLMKFYARVEGLFKLAAELVEEDFETVGTHVCVRDNETGRLGDWETMRLGDYETGRL